MAKQRVVITGLGVVATNTHTSLSPKTSPGDRSNLTERRQSIRINTELPVKYDLQSNSSGRKNAVVRNLSVSGIGLLLPEQLLVRTPLNLEISVRGGEKFCGAGEVSWQSSVDDYVHPGYFLTGICFKRMTPASQSHLSRFLEVSSPSKPHVGIGHRPPQGTKVESAFENSFKGLRKLYDSTSVMKKADLLSSKLGVSLHHIKGCTYDTRYFKGNIENPIGIIQIPLTIIGPLHVKGRHAVGEFWVPMATTEGALALTYDLGARLLRLSGPVEVEVISKTVHCDPMFPVIRGDEDIRVSRFVDENYQNIKNIAEHDSHHTTLLRIEKCKIAHNLVLKFLYDTYDAHGLNMINHATFNACKYIESKTGVFFYHRSHYSGVKHHSLLNEEEGYGRVVKSSAVISEKALKLLGVTARALKDFCDRCIECGNAAGIRSLNVHAANAITAIFLSCGQDAADISSAHVCQGRTELVSGGKELYWECMLRNLLIGTVGGGTHLGTQAECLNIMGCLGSGKSDKLAEIIAAVVLAGEFPTAASVVNRTYVTIHDKYGRNKNKDIS